MSDLIQLLGYTIPAWVIVPVIYFVWVTVLLFFKNLAFRAIKRFAKTTDTHLDDIFTHSADFPILLLIFTSGGALVEQMLPVATEAQLTNYFLVGFKVTTVIAIVLFVDRFSNGILHAYSNKIDILRSSGGIARGIVRIIVIGLGLLILLDSFGVSITPLIASLGIGSLAVALAIQPTLENFFAGIQIIADQSVKVGHFVKLESGEEGYIHKIGWRSTWLRMLPNNVVVIPNKLLIDSRLTNYYYPETEMAVLVEVGVHYQSDLEKVEQVTVEVAKQTLQEVPGGVKEFQPFIRYHTFNAYSINFSVILRAKEFVDNYLIKHEFIKRLHKRFAQEGIVIPYPIEAVNLTQEQAFELDARK